MRHVRLLALTFLCIPFVAGASALININTANLTTLEDLPHVGPTIAQRIIDGRPYAKVSDLQKVKGIGDGTYYADISPLVTVGESATETIASSTDTGARAATTYVPPPAALSVELGPDARALLNVPLTLTAVAHTSSGALDPSARVLWSFGDGSVGEGRVVEKTFRHTGTFLVTASASDGEALARDDVIVSVGTAQVRVRTIAEGVLIANDASERLDLSGWRLLSDTGFFRIPTGTLLLPRSETLFPSEVTNLPVAQSAALQYPDGTIAATSNPPASPAVQPLPAPAGLEEVQAVEPISSPEPDISRHEEAVGAPREMATSSISRGAVLSEASVGAAPTSSMGLLKSPWTLGFLGVLALAGGAFIFL